MIHSCDEGGLKGLAYSMIELNKTVAKHSMGKNRAFQLILATTNVTK